MKIQSYSFVKSSSKATVISYSNLRVGGDKIPCFIVYKVK